MWNSFVILVMLPTRSLMSMVVEAELFSLYMPVGSREVGFSIFAGAVSMTMVT